MESNPEKNVFIAFRIMLHTAFIILLLLSSSFGDKGDDAKLEQKIVKNTPKLEEKETIVDDNSGGSELEAAKDLSQPKVVESNGSDVSGKVKVDESKKVNVKGNDLSGKVKVDESGKEKVERDDVSGKAKVEGDRVSERVAESGKVILLYHPINTKSHRNQQNAIAEVFTHPFFAYHEKLSRPRHFIICIMYMSI